MDTNKPVTPERIMQFAWGYAPTLILEAAIKHKIFDLLDESPKALPQLAKATGASTRGLTAVLEALVALQFLNRSGAEYSLTPESATFLVSNKPAYHGAFFHHVSADLIPKWLQLTEVVRTGRPAQAVNQNERGAGFFAGFVESLFPLSYPGAKLLGEHLGLSRATTPISVLDLAAGSGVWGIALAQQSPKVRVTAVDWPNVLEVTRKVAQKHGVVEQLSTAPGDLLQADFGTGHDVATLGHILHSEGRARSRQLLRKTFAALAPGGTIAIAEFIPNDDRTGPPPALLFAVTMLINTDEGDVYTVPEMSEWLRDAGFINPRTLDVKAPSPLLLATKPA